MNIVELSVLHICLLPLILLTKLNHRTQQKFMPLATPEKQKLCLDFNETQQEKN